jgi:hypothetical protein
VVDLLVTRPADDSSAAQIATWGQTVIQRVGTRSYVDLPNGATTRAAVDEELRSGIGTLLHFGHGTESALRSGGSDIVDARNAPLVGKAIIAMACDSTVRLGRDAVDAGVPAYLGFDDLLGFPANAPLPMGRAIAVGIECLLTENHDLECGASQLRQRFEEARVDYRENGSAYGLTDSEARFASVFMKSNLHSLQLLGDPTTTI